MTTFRAGDLVHVTAEGRTVEAYVGLASRTPDGHPAPAQSLVLTFDAILGGWVGQMPVFFKDGEWHAIGGMQVTITHADHVDD